MLQSWSNWGIALTCATVIACGGSTDSDAGGPDATGGVTAGGTGGDAVGGTSTGATGGTSAATGGTSTAGTGGATPATGGTATGGAATGGTATGGAATGGTTTGGAATGGTPPIGGGGGMMGCFVGVQLDDCCSAPIPGDALVVGNPCFVAYSEQYAPEVYTRCPAAELCLALDCAHAAPASRVVARRAEGCVFVDECDPADIDCRVAVDYNRCCSCPEVVPQMIVEVDPCVVEVGEPAPAGCADCSSVDCMPCPGEVPVASCGYRGDPALGICSAAIQ